MGLPFGAFVLKGILSTESLVAAQAQAAFGKRQVSQRGKAGIFSQVYESLRTSC
jgi:hypothetical protein